MVQILYAESNVADYLFVKTFFEADFWHNLFYSGVYTVYYVTPLKPGKYCNYVILASGINVRGRNRQSQFEGSVNEKGKGARQIAYIGMREKR